MYEIIYLEPDAEITSVIERFKKNESKAVALVVPRGATLAQSIVNLKLLKRSAKEAGKEIGLVTNDRIGRNLASQIGLSVFSKVAEAEKAVPSAKNPEIPIEMEQPSGDFKINSYYRNQYNEPGDSLEEEGPPDEENELKDEVKKELEAREEEAKEAESEEKPVEMEKRTVSPPHQEKYNPVHDDKKDHKPAGIKMPKKILLIAGGVTLVVILVLAFIFIPYATTSITVRTEDFKAEKEVAVDRSVTVADSNEMTIPGKILEVEKEVTKTYISTGTKDAGVKATGKITVYNSWDANPQLIAKNSKFSSGGKIFISNAEVTVPGGTLIGGQIQAGTIEVSVTAEQSGDSHNLAPSNFVITTLPAGKQVSIYGKSTVAMTGGVTKTVKIVSDKDLANAETDAVAEAKKSTEELSAKATEEKQTIIDSAIKEEIVSTDSTKKANEEADNFDYKVKVKLFVIGFNKDDLRNVIVADVSKTLETNKTVISPEKSDLVYNLETSDVNAGTMKMKTEMTCKIGDKILASDIVNQVKNKKLSSAKNNLLANQNVVSASIIVWPSFIKRTPLLKNRIKVQFDYEQ